MCAHVRALGVRGLRASVRATEMPTGLQNSHRFLLQTPSPHYTFRRTWGRMQTIFVLGGGVPTLAVRGPTTASACGEAPTSRPEPRVRGPGRTGSVAQAINGTRGNGNARAGGGTAARVGIQAPCGSAGSTAETTDRGFRAARASAGRCSAAGRGGGRRLRGIHCGDDGPRLQSPTLSGPLLHSGAGRAARPYM